MGKISGEGVHANENGATYNGQFVNGQKHGLGIYDWPDHTIYSNE
jgi:hypothetical protein